MSTALAPAAAVPVADVSPEHLCHVTWVRAFDPGHPGVAVWLPVENPTGHPGVGGRCLEVMIDNDRRDEQLRRLRAMIRLTACCG